MTGILDGTINLDGASVSNTGIKALLKDAARVGIAVDDLKDLTRRLGTPIMQRAKALAPKGKTGRLAKSIRIASSKRAVRVTSSVRLYTRPTGSRVGHYSGVNHYGADATSGPRWLSKAEEQLPSQTFAGFGAGIKELLDKYNW